MNPRQIEAFKRVIESGTVTVAAHAMHVSQPAVTKLLQAFERTAGFALFARARGRPVPTPEAKLLYQDVNRLFTATHEVRRSADEIWSLRKEALSVGAMPALCTGFVQRVSAAYLGRHPGINLVVHTAPRLKLIDRVASRTLDIALCHAVPDNPEIGARVFSREPAVCLLPPRHPLTRRSRVAASDLAGCRSSPGPRALRAVRGWTGCSTRCASGANRASPPQRRRPSAPTWLQAWTWR